MKKVLLGTSAIALLGAATTANAAEWDVSVGGYMEQQLGYASFDSAAGTDFDGFDIKSDQEVSFRGTITLDNGLQFQARMDLEAASSGGDRMDEPHLRINGSFGSIRIGEDDLASYDVAVTAPDVTFIGLNSGDTTLWAPGGGLFGTNNAGMTRVTLPAVAADPVNITYFSPRFAGFQIGASYAPNSGQSDADAQPDRNAVGLLKDIFAVGLNYSNSFGDFDVAASAAWNTGTLNGAPDTNPESYAAGLALGFGGFTLGGSWGEGNETGNDGRTWDVGVSYETGPWGFSFTYLHSERADNVGVDDEIDEFLLGVDYDLAQGVRLGAWGFYTQQDDGTLGAADDDGFGIGTGVRVSF